MSRKRFSLVMLWCLATTAIAYGPTGHEIIGAIADGRLANTAAGAEVNALIDGLTLERAATMADEIRAWDRNGADDLITYPHYSQHRGIEEQLRAFWRANPATNDRHSPVPSHHWFHYTDVPVRHPQKYGDGKTGRSQWDIVHMIRFCVQVLKGEVPEDNPRKITKPVAVILLAHYVGDIHQPLHVGAEYFNVRGKRVDPDREKPAFGDQGGNSIILDLPAGNRSGPTKGKLHGFWDNDSVIAQFPSLSSGLKGKEQAEALKGPKQEFINRLATQEPRSWRLPASVKVEDFAEAWANDILPVAREAHERLRFTNIHRQPEVDNTVAEGTAMEQPMPDRVSYRDWSARIVRDELHKAGWRLADLVERALSTSSSPIVSASSSPRGAVEAQANQVAASPSPVITATPAATKTPTAETAVPPASPTLTPRPPTPVPKFPSDPIYGEYPIKYKDIIMDWLYTHLHDPLSAKIEWQTEPKRADLPGPRGRKLYGYLVLFTVNARNQFGAYTGKQSHGALIRNGEIIKTTGFGYGSIKSN